MNLPLGLTWGWPLLGLAPIGYAPRKSTRGPQRRLLTRACSHCLVGVLLQLQVSHLPNLGYTDNCVVLGLFPESSLREVASGKQLLLVIGFGPNRSQVRTRSGCFHEQVVSGFYTTSPHRTQTSPPIWPTAEEWSRSGVYWTGIPRFTTRSRLPGLRPRCGLRE